MAMLDVMISDLPHVEYRKEKILQEDIEKTNTHTEQVRERVKKHGLGISFNKNAVDANKIIQDKLKGK